MRLQLSEVISRLWRPDRRNSRPWHGGSFTEHPSWEAAVAASRPYETDLSAFGAVAERIRRGEQNIGRNLFPVLAGVLLGGGKVIDFGGGLGLVYFDAVQHIGSRIDWWRIVDLPDVVAYGNANLANGKLAFFSFMDEALNGESPDVILCSHTLQYLPDPYGTVEQLLSVNPNTLILHELPLAVVERYFVQKFPPELGAKEFPVRILSEAKLAEATRGYDLIEEMDLRKWTPFEGLRHVARLYRRKKG